MKVIDPFERHPQHTLGNYTPPSHQTTPTLQNVGGCQPQPVADSAQNKGSTHKGNPRPWHPKAAHCLRKYIILKSDPDSNLKFQQLRMGWEIDRHHDLPILSPNGIKRIKSEIFEQVLYHKIRVARACYSDANVLRNWKFTDFTNPGYSLFATPRRPNEKMDQ